MKHRLPLVAVCLLAAFALGATVASQPAKFPWASEALNKDCGKTELEARMLATSIDREPYNLSDIFTLTGLKYLPTKDGLKVQANVSLKTGFADRPKQARWRDDLDDNCTHVIHEVQRRLNISAKDMPEAAVELFIDNKPAAVRDGRSFKVCK